jgi:hypothetical protein
MDGEPTSLIVQAVAEGRGSRHHSLLLLVSAEDGIAKF